MNNKIKIISFGIFLGLGFFIIPSFSFAVSFSTSSVSEYVGASVATSSITVNSANSVLIVITEVDSGGIPATTTFNGTVMTKAYDTYPANDNIADHFTTAYFLNNPSIGTYIVSSTRTSGAGGGIAHVAGVWNGIDTSFSPSFKKLLNNGTTSFNSSSSLDWIGINSYSYGAADCSGFQPTDSVGSTYVLRKQSAATYQCLYDSSGSASLAATTTVTIGNVPSGTGLLFSLHNNAGGGGITPVLNFIWPNSDPITPDFNNWVVSLTNIPTSTTGILKVWYSQSSTTFNISDSINVNSSSSFSQLLIHKSVLLNPIIALNQSSTWYAYLQFNYATSSVVTSSQISFTVNPNFFSIQQTSSSIAAGLFQKFSPLNASGSAESLGLWGISTSTLVGSSYTCQGLTDLGNCALYILTSFGNFLFQPSTFSQSYIQSGVTSLQSVFPFSLVFNSLNTINATLTANTTSSPELVWAFSASASGSTTSVSLLSSSTASLTFKDNASIFFNFQKYLMYALTILALFTIVHQKSHTQKT